MDYQKIAGRIKFLTILMAAFMVYSAIVALSTYPQGVNIDDKTAATNIFMTSVIAFWLLMLGSIVYISRKTEFKLIFSIKKAKEKARQLENSSEHRKVEVLWENILGITIFLNIGFTTLALSPNKYPAALLMFIMALYILLVTLWQQTDSYTKFLSKIKKVLPYFIILLSIYWLYFILRLAIQSFR